MNPFRQTVVAPPTQTDTDGMTINKIPAQEIVYALQLTYNGAEIVYTKTNYHRNDDIPENMGRFTAPIEPGATPNSHAFNYFKSKDPQDIANVIGENVKDKRNDIILRGSDIIKVFSNGGGFKYIFATAEIANFIYDKVPQVGKVKQYFQWTPIPEY